MVSVFFTSLFFLEYGLIKIMYILIDCDVSRASFKSSSSVKLDWLFPVVIGWFAVAVIDAIYLPSVVHGHTALLVLSFSFLGVYASRISTLLALLWLFIP